MANIVASHIAGPMLYRKPPASVRDVVEALQSARVSSEVVLEWENIAKRVHGERGSQEIIGARYRERQRRAALSAHRRAPDKSPTKPLSWRQKLARRIARIFRKH